MRINVSYLSAGALIGCLGGRPQASFYCTGTITCYRIHRYALYKEYLIYCEQMRQPQRTLIMDNAPIRTCHSNKIKKPITKLPCPQDDCLILVLLYPLVFYLRNIFNFTGYVRNTW